MTFWKELDLPLLCQQLVACIPASYHTLSIPCPDDQGLVQLCEAVAGRGEAGGEKLKLRLTGVDNERKEAVRKVIKEKGLEALVDIISIW